MFDFFKNKNNKRGSSASYATDPVCLMKVNIDKKALSYEYKQSFSSNKNESYYFCSENCREQFRKDPEKYTQ